MFFISVLSADQMVHKFKNPSFSGTNTSSHYLTIENQEFNRKEAIKAACSIANEGDIILLAGKGHEKYQEINGLKLAFDDKEELKNTFNLLRK